MQSLGLITVATAGTPQQLSATSRPCTQIMIQPVRAGGDSGTAPTQNTGTVYLMRGNTAKSTGLGSCLLVLPIGADALVYRSPKRDGIDLSLLYLDADTNGDGALVSFI